MKSLEIPRSACPQCGYKMDRCTAIDGKAVPKPGDLSLCIECGAYLTFDDELKLEVFPDAQILELSDETRLEITRARKAIARLRADG